MEEKLESLTYTLIEKLERAIDELDSYTVTKKIKEKSVDYEDDGKKPASERIVETEELEIKKGLIDRGALKQLVATLNELKGKEDTGEEENSINIYMSEELRELAQ